MARREVITLPSAQVEVDPRPGYLFVVETGQLRSLEDLRVYHEAMESIIRRTGTRHALIDARGEIGDPPEDVRQAMWQWLIAPGRGFDIVGFVLPTEMAVARVNMTALSQGARVRAFDSVFAAQRWLQRGPKFSTAATRSPSSFPPAQETRGRSREIGYAPTMPAMPAVKSPAIAPSVPAARRPSSPGAYHTTTTRTERPRAPTPTPGDPRRAPSSDGEPKARGTERASGFQQKRPTGKDGNGDGGSQVA